MIPHITNEIKPLLPCKKQDEDRIAIIEVGGTVGDIRKPAFSGGNPPVSAGDRTRKCCPAPCYSDPISESNLEK